MASIARFAARLTASSGSSAAASVAALPTIDIPARTMAHNPKYMRETTRANAKFAALREKVLTGEELFPKPHGAVRRRRDDLYKDVRLPTPLIGKQVIPRAIGVESWIYNLAKQRVGIAPLSSPVWNADTSRVDFVQRVVEWQRAKRRQGTHKSLGRSEVSGSGKKQFAQKGTGRARVSDRLGPQFYHGGHAFPHRPRSFAYTLPMAIRRKGMCVSLSAKRKANAVFLVDAAVAATHKTGALAAQLTAFNPAEKRSLLIHGAQEQDPNFVLAARNIRNLDIVPAGGANVIDVVNAAVVYVTVQGNAELTQRLTARSRSPVFVAAPIKLLSAAEGRKRVAAAGVVITPKKRVSMKSKIKPMVDAYMLRLRASANRAAERAGVTAVKA